MRLGFRLIALLGIAAVFGVGCAGIAPQTVEAYLDATEPYTRAGIASATVTDVHGAEIPLTDEEKEIRYQTIDDFRALIEAAKGDE